jgi:hypothetical protein
LKVGKIMMKATTRRATGDRRVADGGPPAGWLERRRTVERRRPEVREISFAEWLACLRRRPCPTE